ncbi:MAG: hypothetical protein RL660_2000 [Bacteroidota bacterium]|jgi:predicted RND superfamily exporter protein
MHFFFRLGAVLATFAALPAMWKKIGLFALNYRLPVLAILLVITCILGYFGTKVQVSYELKSAISENSSTFKLHKQFKQLFGEDNNTIVIGFKGDVKNLHQAVLTLSNELRSTKGITEVLAIPNAVNIQKTLNTDGEEALKTVGVFADSNAIGLDSQFQQFYNLPFYKNLLYNPDNGTQLLALKLDSDILRTKARVQLVQDLIARCDKFGKDNKVEMHYSGLPLIRSVVATDVQREMKMFLLLSLALTALILLVFFRNIVTVLFSLLIVLAGVAWSMGIMYLLGYQITLLTALIPPLIVVIGIPNCIYFLNKYHQEHSTGTTQAQSLVRMVQRMGVVTLFTNLTAAIGFGVFCLTGSTVLQEFGWVAWLGIIAVFFISLLGIPALFSYLPAPNAKHTNYLDSPLLNKFLAWTERLVFKHRKALYIFWILATVVAASGLLKLKQKAYMVDDLPSSNKLVQDLRYFESNFGGVMPLEIWIDTKKKNGAISLGTLNKIDELSTSIAGMDSMGKPLSVVEAIKFARQAYYDGDSMSYAVPSSLDASFLMPYLRMKNDASASKSQFGKIIKSYLDSTKQHARISVSMADVGSTYLPKIVDSIKRASADIFDTARYKVNFTGTSIVFLEGSKYIIDSLRDSILYALLMIVVCMVLLFRSWRIVLMAMLANIIPLVITAGLMGWLGVPLKPSTVLVFSIALGITVDVTIRFLVAYKQLLPKYNYDIAKAVQASIQDTGLSIVYTSLILIVGFMVFTISNFGGTKALGLLTSFTLLLSMFINLTIVPAFLMWMDKVERKKQDQGLLEEALSEE